MADPLPLVSIVVPAHNAADTLGLCLDACLRQTWPATEVIVVDDGSTDTTASLAENRTGVQYVRQEKAGPAAARNRGAALAKGAFIVFTDADCVPHTDWIDRLMARFEEGVGGVGGTYGIANPGSLLAHLIHREIRMRHARFGEEVDFLGSFNVAYRKEVFTALNGFDTAFRAASGEDNDLAYRAQDAGWRLCFAPEAVVDHFHPTALIPYLTAQMRHGYWRMKLYAKHPRRAATGDHYAGRAALAAPVVALMLWALFFFTWVVGWWLPSPGFASLNGLFLAGLVLFFMLHLPLAWRVTGGWRMVDTPYFMFISTCRDFARGFGLLRGLVRFQGLMV